MAHVSEKPHSGIGCSDCPHAAKVRLSALASGAYERTRHAAEATDHYVHANPWQSVGIGAAAGMLVGFLIARR